MLEILYPTLARRSLLFTLASGMCVATACMLPPEGVGRTVFGGVGYAGLLVFVATGFAFGVAVIGKIPRLFWGLFATWFVGMIAFCVAAIRLTPESLDLFLGVSQMLQWITISLLVGFTVMAVYGWVNWFMRPPKAQGRNSNLFGRQTVECLAWLLMTVAVIAFLGLGFFPQGFSLKFAGSNQFVTLAILAVLMVAGVIAWQLRKRRVMRD